MERVARRSPPGPLQRAVAFLFQSLRERILWIVGLGVAYVLGVQIVDPQTRVIKAAIGIFLFVGLLLAPPVFGLSFFIVTFPFPAYTSYGSTNVMLIFVIAIFWLLRASTGELQVRGKTGFEGFIAAMAIMLCVSLYNAPTAQHVRMGILNIFFYFSAFLLFYLANNLLPKEKDLQRASFALTIATLLVLLTVVIEVYFPFATIVPGWIGVSYSYGWRGARRMGGVVGGHDVLADWCVIMFPLLLFRLYHAKTLPRRLFYAGILLLDIFALVSTANRGGLVGLVFAAAYLLWLTRREFRIVRYTLVAVALVAAVVVFDQYISTQEGGVSILARMSKTRVQRGFVPDTRTEVWRDGWAAFQKHFLIGGGPWFDFHDLMAPHNGFLWSLVCVGILGTIPYVLFLLEMFRQTRHRVRGELERGRFASGFMTVLHVQIASFILLQLRTDYQRSPAYVYLMWLLFGLAVVTMRLLDQEEAAEREERASGEARALATG